MKISKSAVILIATTAGMAVQPGRCCRAADQIGVIGEFSLPDRLRNLVDSQDEYYDAMQRLQDADAAVMRARESAMKDAQSTPEYAAAISSVQRSYQAYIDKKNALVGDMEKKDPVYSRMKSEVAAVDSQIDAARQNPATTREQLEELYKNRETFLTQWHQLESDAMKRAGFSPVEQAWVDSSKKLSDLQDKLRLDVEANERLKGAVAESTAAMTAVYEAHTAISGSVDPANSEQARASDLLCKSSRAGFAGNDAWWTYGWTNLAGSKTSNTSAPAGAR